MEIAMPHSHYGLIGRARETEPASRAAEGLPDSERQWREVFEHNPAIYFMVDAAGAILSVNTFGASQFGYAVSELVGQSVLNLSFEEDKEFVRKSMAVCLETLGQSNSWQVQKNPQGRHGALDP